MSAIKHFTTAVIQDAIDDGNGEFITFLNEQMDAAINAADGYFPVKVEFFIDYEPDGEEEDEQEAADRQEIAEAKKDLS